MIYLRRSVKYFIQLLILFVVLIGVLMLVGMVPKDIAKAFQKGWTSIFYILGLFAVMAAIYPLFGYGKRLIRTTGDPAELWPKVDEALDGRGYYKAAEKEDGSRIYKLKSTVGRAARLWEDRIVVERELEGFKVDGHMRDLARVAMFIDHKINRHD
ncbi:MAG: hypothetical protein IK008_05190 [Bacteroidales bacterium]|nr:hypothetical protein [Bacteroidales bacterium]